MAHTASASSALQNVDLLSNSSLKAEVGCSISQASVQCRGTTTCLRRLSILRSSGNGVLWLKPSPLVLEGSVRWVVCGSVLSQQPVNTSKGNQTTSKSVGQQEGFKGDSREHSISNTLKQLNIHLQDHAEHLASSQGEPLNSGSLPIDAAENALKSSALHGKRPTDVPFDTRQDDRASQPAEATTSDVAETDRIPLDEAFFWTSKKECLHCGYVKNLRDFPKLSSSTDGRHEVCRGCMAAFKAIRLQKELHHLGMTVAEAWEKSKACAKCGEVKELRDYSVLRRNPDGLQTQCRSCESEAMCARPRKIPTDASQVCGACNVRKPASAFGTHRSNANGLNKACRTCRVEREMVRRERKATLFISRTQKYCLKCKTNKSPEEFAKSTLSNDGLTPDCKQCKRSRMRELRERAKGQPAAEGT